VLQARLKAEYADQIAMLHERAAAWYKAAGTAAEAMEHPWRVGIWSGRRA
jgi:ATP/maltotriose-dependent transcriptional regulator MalT